MTLRMLTAKEIYIRLAQDHTAFICTIRYGCLHSKTADFPVQPDSDLLAALERTSCNPTARKSPPHV
jgi:hypothetical protein